VIPLERVAARGRVSAPVSAGVSLRPAGVEAAWAAGPQPYSEATEEAALARLAPEAEVAPEAAAEEGEVAPPAVSLLRRAVRVRAAAEAARRPAAEGAPRAAAAPRRAVAWERGWASARRDARRLAEAVARRFVRAVSAVQPAARVLPRAELPAECRRPLLPEAEAASAAPDRRSRARRRGARSR
jgi:hypothetical protein